MNNRLYQMFLLVGAALTLGVSRALALGILPPPLTPSNFTVQVSSGTAVAHFDPQNASMTLAVDGQVDTSGSGLTGTLTTQGFINPSQSHTFSLTASNLAGTSPAVAYIYNPPIWPSCGEHIVNINITNSAVDSVGGYLASGGSSGFYVPTGTTNKVSLSATSGRFDANLQFYQQTGVPYPQNYHNITGQCSGQFDFNSTCSGNAYDYNGPVVATVSIVEPSSGTFTCSIQAVNP